jgi:predicted nuclease of predicted toxin-antitoxin system
MKFKLDENLPIDLVQIFRLASHDASSVFEQELSGEKDQTLLDICRAEDRALVTLDMDFADVRSYPPDQNRGIVVLRLQRQDKRHVENTIKRLLPVFDSEPVDGRLLIVDENRVRIRK